MKVGRWSSVAGNNNATPPDGWPEGQAPSTVNDCARENMAATKIALQDMDFFDHDFTPTFVNATTFTVPGNQTARLVAGRKLKLFDATTHVRDIGTASFTVVTTVSLGAGTALTNSLSSFAVSIINPSAMCIPSTMSFSAIAVAGASNLHSTAVVGALTVTGAAQFQDGVSHSAGGVSASSGVAVNLVTLPTTATVCLYHCAVFLNGTGVGDASNYCAYAVIMTDNATNRLMSTVAGGLLNVGVSGMNIQGVQSSGATNTISYRLLRIS